MKNKYENDEEEYWARKSYVSKQYKMASVSYGLLVCLIGVVVTTIEPFKTCTKCENLGKIFIESFFIFMYSISILWILLMFILITKAKRERRIAIKSLAGVKRRLSIHHLSEKNKTKKPRHHSNRSKQEANSDIDEQDEKVMDDLDRQNYQKQQSYLSSLAEEDDETGNREATDESITTPLNLSAEKILNKLNNEPNDNADFDNHINYNTNHQISYNNLSANDLNKFYYTYDYENGSGELYMRVGTAIFSICAMIDRVLSLIQMIEALVNNHFLITKCKITFNVIIVSKITSFLFIFLQSYFIFKYANIIINYGKNIAQIGLMHIICTNFCVFLRSIVHETVAEIRHHYHFSPEHYASNSSDQHIGRFAFPSLEPNSNVHQLEQLGCLNTIVSFLSNSNMSSDIEQTHDKLTSYLYPCVIEYSLMCMTIFYILWTSIEQRYDHQSNSSTNNHSANNLNKLIKTNNNNSNNHPVTLIENNRKRSSIFFSVGINPHLLTSHTASNNINNNNIDIHFTDDSDDDSNRINERREVHTYTVDCSKSTTGLFVGLFVLLFTIISLIAYFIYRDKNILFSVEIIELCDIILIALSLITSVSLFIILKMNKFSYKQNDSHYNETLLMVGIAGIYLFGFYSIIAISSDGIESPIEAFSLSIHIISIIESTFQSILIIEAFKLYSKEKSVIRKTKPGRSLITLLILIDVSLWLSETFTLKKYQMNKIQIDYYNIVFWSIVSTVSSPLAIFFRFHSSVCLSEMWKTLYE